MRTTTRRNLLAGALAGAALPAVAGCGGNGQEGGKQDQQDGGNGGSGGGSGPWRFTDDLGNTAKLDAPPENLVAYVTLAAGLKDHGVDVVGAMGDLKNEHMAGDLDPSAIESLGVEYNEFNVEKYLSLNPDVLITMAWDGALWFVPEKVADTVRDATPIIAMEAGTIRLEKMTKRFEELAVSLGGDKDAQGKRHLQKVTSRLEAMAKEKKGLSIVAISGGPDQVWISRPKGYPALRCLRNLGFDIVDPGGKDPFFREFSWEQIGRFDADVIFHDSRTRWLSLPDMKKKATFAKLQAVQADQIVDWYVDTQMSYRRAAIELEAFADQLEAYEPLG